LKDWPLVGNAYIALSMAIAFPFGAAALGISLSHLPDSILWLTIGAFLAGLAREIIKSAQDMEGDKAARGSKHLPILIGARPALALAGLLAIGFCLSLFMLVSSSAAGITWNTLELGMLALSGLVYLTMAFELLMGVPKAEQLERMRKTTLYALGLALAAVALAALM
jgi:4-hydroxybenzoate polyprenyltransferase